MAKRLRRARKPSYRPAPNDYGTLERLQHDVVPLVAIADPDGGQPVTVRYVQSQRQLERLALRGIISHRQYLAGDKLFTLWFRAGRSPNIASTLSDKVDGSRPAGTGLQALAEIELKKICAGTSSRLWPLLVHVCFTDGAPSDWASQHHYAPREGVTLLRHALDEVADFLRLPAERGGHVPRP